MGTRHAIGHPVARAGFVKAVTLNCLVGVCPYRTLRKHNARAFGVGGHTMFQLEKGMNPGLHFVGAKPVIPLDGLVVGQHNAPVTAITPVVRFGTNHQHVRAFIVGREDGARLAPIPHKRGLYLPHVWASRASMPTSNTFG